MPVDLILFIEVLKIDIKKFSKIAVKRIVLLLSILKKKIRPISKKIKKSLSKKKNRRYLFNIGSVFLILILLFTVINQKIENIALNQAINNNNSLIKIQANTSTTLSKALQATKKELMSANVELKKKADIEALMQSEIEKLQTKIDNVVLGKGGGSTQPLYIGAENTNNSYAWGNCTAGVASWIKVPEYLGNAADWGANAEALGYKVDDNPTVNSVGYTKEGTYGHVVLVVGVRDKTVDIKEMNYGGNLGVANYRTVDKTDFKYIHFT